MANNMKWKQAIAFATLTAVLLASGCREETKSPFPAITRDNTPFVRITEFAYFDLLIAHNHNRPTSTSEAVVNEIKRQRIFGTGKLDKGDLLIPSLTDRSDSQSIVTIDSGVEEWALIHTAIWDEERQKSLVTAGLIPLDEYKRVANSRKAGPKK